MHDFAGKASLLASGGPAVNVNATSVRSAIPPQSCTRGDLALRGNLALRGSLALRGKIGML